MGQHNPMYGLDKSVAFNHYAGSFQHGAENPSYKGTYVLEVATQTMYGPFLKAEVLREFKN
jgi:hypothetical protein